MNGLSRVFTSLILVLSVAACGDNSARYLLDQPTAPERVKVRVSTIELRDVTLPAYASASQIVIQEKDGALRPVPKAIWADDPVRAVTLALARNLDLATTATTATEPWPLDDPADVRIEVRIERMVAQADGQYQLAGNFAIASPDQILRESISRFEILQPLQGFTPKDVAQATSASLLALSQQIIAKLRR